MSRSWTVGIAATVATGALIYTGVVAGRRIRAEHVLSELPVETGAVARIEVAALRDNAAARGLLDALVPSDQISEIEAICRFQPLVELREVVVWAQRSEHGSMGLIGLVVRGGDRIDADALAQCHASLVRERGGSVVRVDMRDGPLLKNPRDGSAIAPIAPDSVVAGSERTVRRFLSVRDKSGAALSSRVDMTARWVRESAGAPIAALVDLPESWREAIPRLAGDNAQVSALLASVRSVALSARGRPSLQMRLSAELSSADDASTGALLLEAWRRAPPETLEPVWLELLHRAQVTTDETILAIETPVTSEDVKRLREWRAGR